MHKIRLWDYRTVHEVDKFISISRSIEKRIKKVYGCESLVIYPPVDMAAFTLTSEKDDFYLTASRMVPDRKIVELSVDYYDLWKNREYFAFLHSVGDELSDQPDEENKDF